MKRQKQMIERFRKALVKVRDRRSELARAASADIHDGLAAGRKAHFVEWARAAQLDAEVAMVTGLTYELAYLKDDAELVRTREYLRSCFRQADVEWPRFDAVPWVLAALGNWRPIDVGLLNERLGAVYGLPGWSWYAHDNEFLLGLVRDDGKEAYLVHGLDGVTSWGDVVHGIDSEDGFVQEVW